MTVSSQASSSGHRSGPERPCRARSVLALVAPVLAVVVSVLAVGPTTAVVPPPPFGTVGYTYDALARFLSPDTAASHVRGSPLGPEATSWVSPAFVRDRGVAANTADDVARLADDAVVVRGGTSDVPPAGEVFSGAYAQTLEEAGAFVPYGQLRATTAGEIRLGGGTVDVVPEMTRGGNLNPNHVNICLGPGSCPFGPLIPNPVPKPGRIQ